MTRRFERGQGATTDVLLAAAEHVRDARNNHLKVVLPPGDKCDDATLAAQANTMLGLTVTVPNTSGRPRVTAT